MTDVAAHDAILQDEYVNLVGLLGRENAAAIVDLKLRYSDPGRVLAADHLLPEGYRIAKENE